MDHDLLATMTSLADIGRLRIVGRLADGPATPAELSESLGRSRKEVDRQLERLAAAGLVERDERAERDGPYRLRIAAVHALGRGLASIAAADPGRELPGPDGSPLPAEDARVLRGFFRDDRLTSIPARDSRRIVVLRYLRDRCFTEDRPYPEKEVNQRLALFHPDVASLRRSMVDEGLLTRAEGFYRRPV